MGAKLRRGTIYTRKSLDEGLAQDFNSLLAQREGCEAFIQGQQGEGWRLIVLDGRRRWGLTELQALRRKRLMQSDSCRIAERVATVFLNNQVSLNRGRINEGAGSGDHMIIARGLKANAKHLRHPQGDRKLESGSGGVADNVGRQDGGGEDHAKSNSWTVGARGVFL